jgi:carboxymethylenebutenolidase
MTLDDRLTIREAADPRGGVVLLQEAFGVTPYLLEVADRLAHEGWTTVVPHLYHRSGSPTFAYDVNHGDGVDSREPEAERAAADAILPHALAMTLEGLDRDLDEAFEVLEQRGIVAANSAVMGFCFGGSVALYAAASRVLGAAAIFYGSGITEPHFGVVPAFVGLARERVTPTIAFYGALDKHIASEEVDALENALTTSAAPSELVRFPDAEHGFHCTLRRNYHPGAAEEAWAQTLAWFGTYIPAGG